METLYVVDAGVLFTRWPYEHLEAHLVTTEDVFDEIVNRPSRQRADILIALDRLRVESPTSSMLREVQAKARTTGDFHSLSRQDQGLLAVALGYKKQGVPTVVVSTDLAVLNTAVALGLSIEDPSGRFRRHIRWRYVCPQCGHRVRAGTAPDNLSCPVCGSIMRRRAHS